MSGDRRRGSCVGLKRSRSLSPDPRPGPSCAAPPIPDKAEVPSRKRLFPVGNLANLKMSRDVVIWTPFRILPFAAISCPLHGRRIVFGDDDSSAIDLIVFGHNQSVSPRALLHPPTHRWESGPLLLPINRNFAFPSTPHILPGTPPLPPRAIRCSHSSCAPGAGTRT
jgi:hypothetical protein